MRCTIKRLTEYWVDFEWETDFKSLLPFDPRHLSVIKIDNCNLLPRSKHQWAAKAM